MRELRNEAGLTQDQLAEKLAVSKRTQGNYESGASDAPASYLHTVGKDLGFDVPYILTGERKKVPIDALTDVEALMVKQYRQIPDDDQSAVRRILKAMAEESARQKK